MQSIPSNFWQWLQSLSAHNQVPTLIILAVIAATVAVLVVGILSFTVYKVHRNRLHDALKRDLMERGMSAEEIVAIPRATPAKSRRDRDSYV